MNIVIAIWFFLIGAGFSLIIQNACCSKKEEESYTIDELRKAMEKAIPSWFGRYRAYNYPRIIKEIIKELKKCHDC